MTTATDNQTQVDVKELERLTNESEGFFPEQAESNPETPKPEPEQAPSPTPAPEAQAGQVQTPKELLEALNDTPFKGEDVVKGVQDLVKSYKELQGTHTKVSQKVKPFEQLIERAVVDPNFAETLRLAERAYSDPSFAQQLQHGQQAQEPNLASYFPEGYVTPEGLAKYQQDMKAYLYRDVQQMVSSQLTEMKAQALRESYKSQFKASHPDVAEDLDQLLQWVQSQATQFNPYEIAWKLKTWDNREQSLSEKIRKELEKKIEQAGKASPSAPSAAPQKIDDAEIVKHITRYGTESAKKKYGEARTMEAMVKYTNQAA